MDLTPELTFSNQNDEYLISFGTYILWPWTIDEKDSNPQYLHTQFIVKHNENGRKYTFSDRQNIEYTFEVCWVDPISLFSDSRTDFNPLYCQILFGPKGDTELSDTP